MKGNCGSRLLLVLFLPFAFILTAASTPVTLSPYAEAVAKIIKFDRRVLITMKQESGGSIHRLIGYDDNGFQIMADGVCVPVPDDRTGVVLASLRKKLVPLKYLAFVVETNANIRTDKIGVLKSTDQYEILRIMHTDGIEYEITSDDVIERLKEWEKASPFVILGAGKDWVELEFKILPGDLKAFSEEVYDFCPDAIDQGPRNTAELAKQIQKTKKLFLLWN